MKPDIIGTKEAASILNLTQERVQQLLREGTLEGYKLGREWAIHRHSVEWYRRERIRRVTGDGPGEAK